MISNPQLTASVKLYTGETCKAAWYAVKLAGWWVIGASGICYLTTARVIWIREGWTLPIRPKVVEIPLHEVINVNWKRRHTRYYSGTVELALVDGAKMRFLIPSSTTPAREIVAKIQEALRQRGQSLDGE